MHKWTKGRGPRRQQVDDGYEQPNYAWASCCVCGELVRVTRKQAQRYAHHETCMLCVLCRLLEPPTHDVAE